jgi:hypothetical protein
MTSDMSKNPLVKLGYDPRIGSWERWRFFDDNAIPMMGYKAINALDVLVSQVKSLEKAFPISLDNMREDLLNLKEHFYAEQREMAEEYEKRWEEEQRQSDIAENARRNREDLPELNRETPFPSYEGWCSGRFDN